MNSTLILQDIQVGGMHIFWFRVKGIANCFPLCRIQVEISYFHVTEPFSASDCLQCHMTLSFPNTGKIPFTPIPNLPHLTYLPPKEYSKQ